MHRTSQCLHFSILQVDVEAHEPSVFASGKILLKRHSPVYVTFEMSFLIHQEIRVRYVEVFQLLGSAGYMCKANFWSAAFNSSDVTAEWFKKYIQLQKQTWCVESKTDICQDELFCWSKDAEYLPSDVFESIDSVLQKKYINLRSPFL